MPEPTPRASIVMPAYNAAATIARSIDSALAQTESRIEVLVIDDASTDATANIARQIASRDNRVRVLRQPVNRGPAAARNRGFARARGAWIALLDADDEFETRRIATLLAIGEQQGADLVADNLLLCPADDRHNVTPMLSDTMLPTAKWMSAADFVRGNIGSRHTPRVSYGFMQPIIRRAFLTQHNLRYDDRNRFGEDFLLALACLMHGARWWITPEAMYRYTVQSGTLTDQQSAKDLRRIITAEDTLLRQHPMVTRDPDLADALRRHKAVLEHFHDYRCFADAMKAGTFARALQLMIASPRGLRHILTEGAMQAPRVALKALRGGFRHAPVHPTMAGPVTPPPGATA